MGITWANKILFESIAKISNKKYPAPVGASAPNGPGSTYFRGVTITLGRTPLDELLAHHRDLCLTSHKTHKQQTPMPLAGIEPAITENQWPLTYSLHGSATEIGWIQTLNERIWIKCVLLGVAEVVTSNKEQGPRTDNLRNTVLWHIEKVRFLYLTSIFYTANKTPLSLNFINWISPKYAYYLTLSHTVLRTH